MYLKKSNGGACISLTNQLIVFGSYTFSQNTAPPRGIQPKPQNPGLTNERVELLGQFLYQSEF